MKLKSTGLGDTMLFGELTEMEIADSGVLMRVKIRTPVVWRVRVLLQQRDLRKLAPRLLKPQNVWFMAKFFLGTLFASKKEFQEEAAK